MATVEAVAEPKQASRHDRVGWPDAAIVTIPFLVLVVLTFNNSPDDALITARYARNLLEGYGPVYNVGERVEGFSSPLHLLMTAGVIALPGGAVLLKMKLLSVLCGALTLAATVWLVRQVGLLRWAQVVALLSVAASWNFAVSSSNGLETTAVALLTTVLAAMVLTGRTGSRPVLAAVVAGLLVIARPESVLIAILLAGASLIRPPAGVSFGRRGAWLVGPLVAGVGLLAFRVSYFGDLVPNTYHAKDFPLGEALARGVKYLVQVQPLWETRVDFLSFGLRLGFVALPLAGVVSVFRRGDGRRLAPLLAVVLGQAIFLIVSGGDWMRGARFIVPALPCLVVLMALGAVAFSRSRLLNRRGDGVRVAAAAMLATMCLPVTTSWSPVWKSDGISDTALIDAGNGEPFSDLWVRSRGLVSCVPDGGTVAFTEAGYFAWSLPEVTVVDMRGLTNEQIAKHADPAARTRNGVTDPNWWRPDATVGQELLEREPDLILQYDSVPETDVLGGRYRLIERITFGEGRLMGVYARSDFDC